MIITENMPLLQLKTDFAQVQYIYNNYKDMHKTCIPVWPFLCVLPLKQMA